MSFFYYFGHLFRFEDYCALIIQSWWHQVCEEQKNFRVPSVRPPTMEENYSSGRTTRHTMASQRPGASSALTSTGGVPSRRAAARIIQKAWRRHIVMTWLNYLVRPFTLSPCHLPHPPHSPLPPRPRHCVCAARCTFLHLYIRIFQLLRRQRRPLLIHTEFFSSTFPKTCET